MAQVEFRSQDVGAGLSYAGVMQGFSFRGLG